MYLNILIGILFTALSIGGIYGVYMMIRDDIREEKKKKLNKHYE